jgi:Spy/CpxP family protein refolding chaperone
MKYLINATLAAVLAVAAAAQTPPKPPSPAAMAEHRVKTWTVLLNLSSAQQQEAKAIYTSAAQAEQTVHEGEKDAWNTLRNAVRNNDIATIDQVSATLAQSMAENTATRAKADAAFYHILTPEQQSKFSELESQHVGPFDMPGGPGGPPAMGLR